MGAYLFKNGGYLCVFGTSFTFHLISVLYTAFILPEVPQPKPPKLLVLSKHGSYGTYTEEPLGRRIRFYSENETVGTQNESYEDTSDCEASSNNNNNSKNNNNDNHSSVENESNSKIDKYQQISNNLSPNQVDLINEKLSLLHSNNGGITKSSKSNSNYLLSSNFSSVTQSTSLSTQYQRAGESSTVAENPDESISVYEFIVGSIRSIIRPRPNHTRKCLIALGVIMLLYGIAYYGKIYLFLQNVINKALEQNRNNLSFSYCISLSLSCVCR